MKNLSKTLIIVDNSRDYPGCSNIHQKDVDLVGGNSPESKADYFGEAYWLEESSSRLLNKLPEIIFKKFKL